ncbi:MAG: RES family NAD+ phosphorylase [Anditalea sp.]
MEFFRLIEDVLGRIPLGYGLGGGRWNSVGTPMVYSCNCCALNFLELLSIKGSVVSSSSWNLVTLEISGEIPYLDVNDLPSNWKKRPYPYSTQEFGTQWAKGLVSPVLKVPSCRIPFSRYPQEHNLLINPLHPDFSKAVKLVAVESVSFEVNK